MSLTCPHCNGEDIQSLPGAFQAAELEALARLARLTAPPRRGPCLLIMEFWFLATMAMDLTAKMLHWPETVGSLVLLGIFAFAVFAALRAWAYNREQWPALYQKWQESYICMKCNNIFTPRSTAPPSRQPP